jgi:hypothetical protein
VIVDLGPRDVPAVLVDLDLGAAGENGAFTGRLHRDRCVPRGTIVARCGAGTVEIVSASPGQGYQLDDEQEGARVRFESDETHVEVRVSCRDGRPVGQVEIED